MAILVTMQVGPVDWTKFQAAMEAMKAEAAPGRVSSQVYRARSNPGQVLVLEQWDSHDSMHNYQERVGAEFNAKAGTAGMDWQTEIWELAASM